MEDSRGSMDDRAAAARDVLALAEALGGLAAPARRPSTGLPLDDVVAEIDAGWQRQVSAWEAHLAQLADDLAPCPTRTVEPAPVPARDLRAGYAPAPVRGGA